MKQKSKYQVWNVLKLVSEVGYLIYKKKKKLKNILYVQAILTIKK